MKQEKAKWLALAIVLTAPLLSVIDVFIINVAIPSIKIGIHATDAEVQLVIAGYLLGYAAFLITGGRAGDHFGRKKTFFWGMLAFTIASCLCGLSVTPLQLNATRFLQGVSAAFMVPQSIAFIQVLFKDPKERAQAIGYYGITLGIAAIIGQVLGGYLSGLHGIIDGWRLIFFINLPIGIAALWTTHRYLQETELKKGHIFDYSGVVILTVALFTLIYPLIQGREKGWPWWSIAMLSLSVVTLIYFVRDQRRKLQHGRHPLIDLNLFKIHDFTIGSLAVLFHFMTHTSYLLISAVFFQNGIGLAPATAGLYFIAPGLSFTVASFVASRSVVRYGRRVPLIGILFLGGSFILQALYFNPAVSTITILTLMTLYGFGNGLMMPSLLNLSLRKVPHEFAGSAAGVYSTFQQTASALGISIIGGLFFFIAGSGHPQPHVVGHSQNLAFTTAAQSAAAQATAAQAHVTTAFIYGLTAELVSLLAVVVMLYLLPRTTPATYRSTPASSMQAALE